ncbi:4Fe-4S binding protein [bacterium]|nr:4Fe-4S binding protein [bacterium]
MNHRRDGILRSEGLSQLSPPPARLKAGPVVIIECVESIPCNPCVQACPKDAIIIEGDINNTPTVDYDKCNGCGLCISACPGLAIFVVDAGRSDGIGVVVLPYEYTPLPEKGEIVSASDRAGETVCDALVVRVADAKAFDRTPLISIEVPVEHVMAVRHFKRKVT